MKLKIRAIVITAFTLFLLIGCGEKSGPLFSGVSSPSTQEAVVYIYRLPYSYAKSRSYEIHKNNAKIGELDEFGYLEIKTQPGKYIIKTDVSEMIDKPIEIEFEAQKVYFLRVNTQTTSPFSADLVITSVENTEAEKEIKNCKLSI